MDASLKAELRPLVVWGKQFRAEQGRDPVEHDYPEQLLCLFRKLQAARTSLKPASGCSKPSAETHLQTGEAVVSEQKNAGLLA